MHQIASPPKRHATIQRTSVVNYLLDRGWIFSSRWFSGTASLVTPAIRKFSSGFFALIFPDDCRICAAPLHHATRIPVCPVCLAKPAPLTAEHFCAACRTPFLNPFPLDENGLCGLCRNGLQSFDAAYSFGAYENELRALIHLFKFGKIQTLARPLGKMLASALPREQAFDLIAPMPLHWLKQWKRGFNQSELLAREIARRTGVPVRKVIRRVRNTKAQSGLTNASRRANVERAFRVKSRRSLQGLHILLIDDVMTTGSTAAACATALKKAGAKRVSLLTLARVDRRVMAADRKDRTIIVSPIIVPTISFPESPFSGSFEDAKSGSIA